MSDAARLMDQMYRRQRHIYDLSRKYYLLGRDETIARLGPRPATAVLEIGCGTGRNLIKAARAYPEARFYGLDVSRAMLDTAARLDRARRALVADRDRRWRRHGLRSSGAVRPAAVRAGDDLLRPVDDPAVARSACPGARRRCAERRIAACRRFRRLRRLAGLFKAGLAPLARRLRRDAARGSRRALAALASARGFVSATAPGGAATRRWRSHGASSLSDLNVKSLISCSLLFRSGDQGLLDRTLGSFFWKCGSNRQYLDSMTFPLKSPPPPSVSKTYSVGART